MSSRSAKYVGLKAVALGLLIFGANYLSAEIPPPPSYPPPSHGTSMPYPSYPQQGGYYYRSYTVTTTTQPIYGYAQPYYNSYPSYGGCYYSSCGGGYPYYPYPYPYYPYPYYGYPRSGGTTVAVATPWASVYVNTGAKYY